jgi:hypothetical protein
VRNIEILNFIDRLKDTIEVDGKKLPIFYNLKGEKFLYALNKNKHLLDTYSNQFKINFRLNVVSKYPQYDKYFEYEIKMRDADNRYSEDIKDLMNKLSIEKKNENPNEQAIKDLELALDSLREKKEKEVPEIKEKLKEEYKESIIQQSECQKEWEKALDEEATIQLHMINREDVPVDAVDEQYRHIVPFIKGFFDEEGVQVLKNIKPALLDGNGKTIIS